jgi:excisionase family DNA binding protein
MPEPERLLIDIPTAARKLSTTVFAVRELLRSDKIKYVAIGHKWLISPAALQDFIRKAEVYHGERAG